MTGSPMNPVRFTLYAKLLGLTPPWGVEKGVLKLKEGEVHITVALPSQLWVCPECLERAPIHDHRERTWRHLDTFQYQTLLHARVPRLNCPTHGVKQLRTGRFTGGRCVKLDVALSRKNECHLTLNISQWVR